MQPTEPKSPRDRRLNLSTLAASAPLSILLKILGVIVLGAVAAAIAMQKPLGQIIAETTQADNESVSSSTGGSGSVIAAARSRKIAEMQGKFKVATIAGKSPQEVEKVLGKPMFSSSVSPSLAPCPCDQKNYEHGLIEIIYIRGKADWITINLPKEKVDTVGSYLSTQVFKNPDFVSIKVATN